MIHNGIPINEIETYLHARAWLTDAARLLGRTPEALAAELIDTMLSSGAATIRDERLHARAEHTHVPRATLQILHPSDWR